MALRIFIDTVQLNTPNMDDDVRRPLILQHWTGEKLHQEWHDREAKLCEHARLVYSPEPQKMGDHLVRLWIEVDD